LKTIQFFLFFSFCALCHSIQAQDLALAQSCVACHGEKGISVNDHWPNIARQKEIYLSQQLKAYKSGERFNEIMTPIAKMLSDDDIQKLSNYFSNMEADQ